MFFHGGLPEQLHISNYIYIFFHRSLIFSPNQKILLSEDNSNFYSKIKWLFYSVFFKYIAYISEFSIFTASSWLRPHGSLRMVAFQSYFILSIGSIPYMFGVYIG